MKKSLAVLMVGACLSVTLAAQAAPTDAQVQQLERKVNILSEEIGKLRLGEEGKTPVAVNTGLGPKASKVYSQNSGVSLAGYGEMVYDGFSKKKDDGTASGKTNTIDALRQVIYLGYKFSDTILFNSEIEFEHASTETNGAVSVEFAYLDFLTRTPVNFRSGMILIPMGIMNETHEPPTFYSVRRNNVETAIIPATWSGNGVGVFGDITDSWSYKLYLTEGLRSKVATKTTGFDASGIREGRQGGSKSVAENLAVSGRLDYQWNPGSYAGFSFYSGGTSQGDIVGTDANIFIWDIHTRMKMGQLELRGLYASTTLADADQINVANSLAGNTSVGSKQYGWYTEVAYDVLPVFVKNSEMGLVPFVRYERLNTQAEVPSGYTLNDANDRTYWVYGVSFLPNPNVALKLDYQDEQRKDNSGSDAWRCASSFMF